MDKQSIKFIEQQLKQLSIINSQFNTTYLPFQNRLLVLQIDKHPTLYLFDIDPIQSTNTQQSHHKFSLNFLDRHQSKLNFNDLSQIPTQIAVSPINDNLISLYNQSSVYTADITNNEFQTITFQEINITNPKANIKPQNIIHSVKWHIHQEEYLFILVDTRLLLFDVSDDIENYEQSINVDITKCSLNRIVDFCLSNNSRTYDLSEFAIFFLDNKGNIYYKCPFVLKNQYISNTTITNLKSHSNYQRLGLQDKNLIDKLSKYESVSNLRVFSNEELQNMNNQPIQGPLIVSNFDSHSSNKYCNIYKLEHDMHLFIRVSDNGSAEVLLSTDRVKCPSLNHKNEIMMLADFDLLVIDAFQNKADSLLMIVQDNQILKINLQWICDLNISKNIDDLVKKYKKSCSSNYNYQVLYQQESDKFGLVNVIGNTVWIFNQNKLDLVPISLTKMYYQIDKANQGIQDSIQKLMSIQQRSQQINKVDNDWLILKTVAKPTIDHHDVFKNINNFENYINQSTEVVLSCEQQFQSKSFKIQNLYNKNKELLENVQQKIKSIQRQTGNNENLENRYKRIQQKQELIEQIMSDVLQKMQKNHFIDLKEQQFKEHLNNLEYQSEEMNQQIDIIEQKINQNHQFLDKLDSVPLQRGDSHMLIEYLQKMKAIKDLKQK